ncbi:PPE family protein [Mycobacterium stomatepiae]|uniref:PPE family protein n=1 Tax=Mycobacterium stomatepiae TaxID=470076 RepID=A0A7I7Q8T8_9MYCO|nr:PPE family protein [Mycobacterium stomatepiae]MCV7164319.1 PPE domain-containing protein [Mycobacterium stomatepiae]BBY22492.1 PPE family protein [Mycobacterium stomatepiae]
MEFETLPPEVNSGLMYAGPGSGPMLAAAAAWETLAAELHSTANSYESVVSGLTAGPWLGPSSVSMTAAASSYVAWLSRTAAQAEQTASQARAVAAAYEAAFAATVPPPVVAANRTQLMSLVATNVLGQNTAAIAVTEAQYGEMWAQDAAAMYGYSGSAATASQLTPFSPAQQNTNQGGSASQADVVSQASRLAAGNAQSTVSSVSDPASSVSDVLGSATNALGLSTPRDALDLGADAIAYGIDAPLAPLGAISLPIDLVGAQTGLHTDDIVSGWDANGVPSAAVSETVPSSAPAADFMSTRAVAGLGQANTIGSLSVPPTWAAATPSVRPIALALPAAPAGLAPQAMAPSLEGSFGEMALAGTAGRAIREGFGAKGRELRGKDPIGVRPVSAAAPKVGDADAVAEGEPRTVVTGIAAEIREFARLRDEGLLTDQQFNEQRNRLLGL